MWVKTQASGTGLTLVSAFAPTLGIELPYWARLAGAGFGIAMLVWPALSYFWSEFRQASLALKLFFVCCGVPVAAIWGMAWWTMPVKAIVPTAAAKPTPTVQQPPRPPPSWVSKEEIETSRKSGHILLPFRPDELAVMRLSSGSDEGMSAYVGKWVKISATFRSLSRKTLSDKKDYSIVAVYDRGSASTLLFEVKKWEEPLVQFKNGSRLDAVCQLVGFSGTDPIFWNCELQPSVSAASQ